MIEDAGLSVQERARILCADALRDERRYDGAPFFAHAEGVAMIVQDEIGLPQECVSAVYLHEATRVCKDLDVSSFPADVRGMAEALNKISTIKPKDTRLEAENYKKLIVNYSTDPRVTVIKIADRLEVMRHLAIFPKSSREKKLLETLLLYIPLAHQLGLYNIKREMEDIYLRYAQPSQYRQIVSRLKAGEKDREKLTQEFVEPLKKRLSEAGIKYKLKVRTKSAYSIYSKMQKQKVDFDGVFDVFAIRFIIDCESDPKLEKDLCWQVYSYVTEEYTPDLGRLRDWLTNPKPNGYESLHITVSDRQGRVVEVQIRTVRMDEEAENGASAHWAYKGVRHEQNLDRWLSSVRYSLEHPSEVKPEDVPQMRRDEIFVFTPTGELRILPEGASVLDFAFNIHSGLGCKCTGGRVNGRAVQLREKLCTGDTVEIFTSRNQHPGKDWLSWVVTSKARTKIKQELEGEERKCAALGREILERRLRNWKLEFPLDMISEYIKARKMVSIVPFMAAIGRGEVDLSDIKAFILSHQQAPVTLIDTPVEGRRRPVTEDGGDDILVINAKGVRGLEYKMALCCNPVYGDDVFGFVTRTQGITIHRKSCPNAARLFEKYPYRCQSVVWQDSPSSGGFQVPLCIEASPEQAVLGRVMEVIGAFRASIRSFNVAQREKNHVLQYDITARILVPSNLELDKVISQIEAIPEVKNVRRG